VLRISLILLAFACAPTLVVAQEAAPQKTPPKASATPPAKPPPKPAPTADGHTVGEVVVTADKPAIQTSIDRRSYSVSGDLQAQSGSIGDALRNVPSVEVDVQGNVALRGDPNVTILVDGKPSGQFQGDNKGQALQSFPASQIERVEVITNPSAEFRAEGTGGIINLITKKAKGAGPTGSVKATIGNRARGTASLTGGYNSGKLSLTGDLSFRHDEQHQVVNDDRFQPDPAGGFDELVQDQDLQLPIYITQAHGALNYDLDAKTRLGLETRASYVDFHLFGPTPFREFAPSGDLTSAFNRDLDIRQWRSQGEVSANARRKLDDKGQEINANLSYEAYNDDRIRSGHNEPLAPPGPESFDRQRLNYDLRHTELKADYVKPIGEGGTLKAGLDLEGYNNSYGNLGSTGAAADALVPDAATTNVFLFKERLNQGYVSYERPFGDLSVLAGLRVEDTHIDLNQRTQGRTGENNYTKLFPTLHLGWKLDDEQKLTASYSHRIQRPDPLQFNTFLFKLDPLNFLSGNAALKPSETRSYELGYEYRASPSVYLATLYYRDNFNGFSNVVTPLANGQFLTTVTNVSKSRSAGVELVASGRIVKGLTYNISSNLYWMQIDPQPLGSPETRSAFSASGRGNVTWQVTSKDMVQFNGFLNGSRLTSQGHLEPFGALNIGYRRKITDQLSFLMTANDVLHTIGFRSIIDTPTLKARQTVDIDSRQFQAGFTWSFGGGRPKDQGFDFGNGGGGAPQ
jgi:outer membrane receptor protein involved in Fe transport